MSSVFNDLKQIDPRTVSFTMSPTQVTYANTLRRAVQTEVQVVGFRADMTENGSTTDVRVFKNSTPMSNEMLADRIGLLPVVNPPGDGWDKDRVLFRLRVVNDTDEVRTVTAADFECLEKRADSEERVRIPNTQFFHPDPFSGETCIIAVLKPMIEGQEPEEIHLEAYASLGKGSEHTRFNPTSQCAYGYTRDTDAGRNKELFNSWLMEQKKVDPAELEADGPRKAVLEREFRSLEMYRCYLQDADGEAYSYDFKIETLGTLPIQTIVYQALLGIATLADKYSSVDRGDLPENLEIRPADAKLKGYDLWFSGEGHTLGNMLQTWLDDNRVGRGGLTYVGKPTVTQVGGDEDESQEGGAAGEIGFAGYKVPHPLRDEMVLRIGVSDGKQETVRLAVAEAAQACADMFRTWAVQWVGACEDIGLTTLGKARNPWEAHAEARGKPKA